MLAQFQGTVQVPFNANACEGACLFTGLKHHGPVGAEKGREIVRVGTLEPRAALERPGVVATRGLEAKRRLDGRVPITAPLRAGRDIQFPTRQIRFGRGRRGGGDRQGFLDSPGVYCHRRPAVNRIHHLRLLPHAKPSVIYLAVRHGDVQRGLHGQRMHVLHRGHHLTVKGGAKNERVLAHTREGS